MMLPVGLQVPSTSRPPSPRLPAICAHASLTADSSYCRSTFSARMSRAGRGSATLNPPRRKRRPGRA